jgi:hypothetical protein
MAGQQNDDRRYRWSSFCQPGERLVARGGVEPPTFRFSGGRSYQLSYLAVPLAHRTRWAEEP